MFDSTPANIAPVAATDPAEILRKDWCAFLLRVLCSRELELSTDKHYLSFHFILFYFSFGKECIYPFPSSWFAWIDTHLYTCPNLQAGPNCNACVDRFLMRFSKVCSHDLSTVLCKISLTCSTGKVRSWWGMCIQLSPRSEEAKGGITYLLFSYTTSLQNSSITQDPFKAPSIFIRYSLYFINVWPTKQSLKEGGEAYKTITQIFKTACYRALFASTKGNESLSLPGDYVSAFHG